MQHKFPVLQSSSFLNGDVYKRQMSTRHGRVVFLEDVLNRAVEQTREIIREKGVNTDNVDETAKQVGIGAVVFQELLSLIHI